MLLWVDIENEPQVQYLLPLVEACQRLGARTIVTARDYGATFQLLHSRDVPFHPVGASYGASKRGKIVGLVGRSRALAALLRREGVPDSLVCASRAAVFAARRLGVRSYAISDYEYANLTPFRWAGSVILFPSVIGPEVYRKAGFSSDRLVGFDGLKEDLTFAGVDFDTISPAKLTEQNGADPGALVRILVRPPAEESHYYRERSRPFYLAALQLLAQDERAVLVLAPRYSRQIADLDGLAFANPPVVLEQPVPFVSLLKAVDLVLCSGGTMLREAAFLGVPAYSIFGSRVGAVDKHLEKIGRATLLSTTEQFSSIRIEKARGLSPLPSNPELVNELSAIVLAGTRPG